MKNEEFKICDSCGEKAINKIEMLSKPLLHLQKVCYSCDTERCLKQFREYTTERDEIIKIIPLKQQEK